MRIDNIELLGTGIGAGSVLNATTSSITSQINDRGSSGYFDIGSVRVQWGTESNIGATGTTTLPVAFANANYSLVLTAQNSNTANVMTTSYHTRTTTNFAWVKRLLTSGTMFDSTGPFNWIAIGLKP